MRIRHFILFVLMLILVQAESVMAAASCSVSVSPSSLSLSTSSTLAFSVNNTGSSSILWIRINSPSNNFEITSAEEPGSWALQESDTTHVSYYTEKILPGGSQSFNVIISTGQNNVSQNWSVEASEEFNGGSPFSCGNPTVAIGQVFAISSISVGSITTSGATITWTTNEAASSVIEYGTTTAYGSTATDTNLATSHSVNLTGLSSGTTYNFRIKNINATGATVESGNNAVTTATTSSSGSSTTSTTTITVTKTVEVKDTASPTLSLSTNFKKVYAQAPEIVGKASDASGVARVEYTLDGKNWLPVDSIDKQFGKSVSFSFLPGGLLDGNYPIKIRVTDAAGNVGFSPTYTLVIDRLPPRVGLAMWSVGPLVIEPTILEGMKLKLSLSAVGGPTEIVLCIKYQVLCRESKLSKDEETGLWSGEIKFDKAGEYKITAASVDGADNKTTNNLGTVRVLPAGVLPAEGTVTVYYFEPTGGQFRIWDGRPFDQVNPQSTDASDKYHLMLPAGKYYLEATAPEFRKARTEIFTLDKTTPVNINFDLKKRTWWPWEVESVAWEPAEQAPETGELPTSLPFFALPSDTGELVYSSSLRGVPTVVTFLSSWVPMASEQVTELQKLANNKNYKVVVVFAQQPQSLVEIFKKRGGYSLTMLADADGELLEPLDISSVPTHVFLDRKGKITGVRRGVLNEEELLNELSK
ncbi:TPA: hypothetical protein DIS61_01720 [Patescibacteria group bacterium]|nr:hypothetical protein [Patescibacteria group bacterium]